MFNYGLAFLLVVSSAPLLAQSAETLDLRDPTTPLQYSPETGVVNTDSGLELQSVLVSNQRKVAVINGSALREGQQLPGGGGVKVRHILPHKVVLQQGEKIWALNLAPAVKNK